MKLLKNESLTNEIEVNEGALGIMLDIENWLTGNTPLPNNVRELTSKFYKDLKKLIITESNDNKRKDIDNIVFKVNITYSENNKN